MTHDSMFAVRLTLNEMTLRSMRSQVDAKNKRRSDPVRSKLISISPKGVLQFKSESITMDPGNLERWDNFVELCDWEEAMGMKDLNYFEKANLAVFGDIKVQCSCPAFLYWGYEFIVSEYDARYEGEGGEDWEGKRTKEGRPPVIRNPKLDGIVCKHLVNVLTILTFTVSKVAARMKELDKVKKSEPEPEKEEPKLDEGPVAEEPKAVEQPEVEEEPIEEPVPEEPESEETEEEDGK